MHSKHPWRLERVQESSETTGEEEEERYLNPNAPRLPQNFGSPCSFRKALCSAFIKAMDSTRVLAGIVFFLIFNFYFSGVGSFW